MTISRKSSQLVLILRTAQRSPSLVTLSLKFNPLTPSGPSTAMQTPTKPTDRNTLVRQAASPARLSSVRVPSPVPTFSADPALSMSTTLPIVSMQAVHSHPYVSSSGSRSTKKVKNIAVPDSTVTTPSFATSAGLGLVIPPAARPDQAISSAAAPAPCHPMVNALGSVILQEWWPFVYLVDLHACFLPFWPNL